MSEYVVPPADALVAAPKSAPLAEAVRLPSVALTTRPALFDAELVSFVDSGALTLEVTRRIPLTELAALHAESAQGPIAGKVIVIA